MTRDADMDIDLEVDLDGDRYDVMEYDWKEEEEEEGEEMEMNPVFLLIHHIEVISLMHCNLHFCVCHHLQYYVVI